jgi:threonyl-tRNA synthetase
MMMNRKSLATRFWAGFGRKDYHRQLDSDFSATPFKAKISNAEQLRVHTMLVIGGRDMEAGAVSVRLHHGDPQGAKPKGEVVADILASIKERRA